ncbi:glycine cleavage system aminomethyltransferase GcvT [Parvularcula lutaonensis]|uniref:aminomethyltransferase n=1 Tax=Parvularcula lutaonensis TaxID=491923 RepID=A0ABV7ME83_9PROT|nr:glycine cleavage system aminomethyltransferase GcvT [Parvularcula lutaonensis]GGY54857.1 aminomethyltransferase [Parvularcula lutaonensis]
MSDDTKKLPLNDLHEELGGKMVPFAGYSMPVQFPTGVKEEHLWVRENAGLFDVSHMGQAFLSVESGNHGEVAGLLEKLVPGEIQKLGKGRIRYTLLLNDEGGILDDLMVTRLPENLDREGQLFLVVNAAVKEQDYKYIEEQLGDRAKLEVLDRCLLAIQGPKAHEVIAGFDPEAAEMPFMSVRASKIDGVPVLLSRCGYTGEDGYEISVANGNAEKIARLLLDDERVKPIGLGARDSLRLEAGLCLYGHDMNPEISPVGAALTFAIGKRRREEGGFAGAERVLRELNEGCSPIRVGIKPSGRAPAREGVEIKTADGETIGKVTSGGFGPTVEGPVAMGYVPAQYAEEGTDIMLDIRGKLHPAQVVRLPFIEPRYYRGPKK